MSKKPFWPNQTKKYSVKTKVMKPYYSWFLFSRSEAEFDLFCSQFENLAYMPKVHFLKLFRNPRS